MCSCYFIKPEPSKEYWKLRGLVNTHFHWDHWYCSPRTVWLNAVHSNYIHNVVQPWSIVFRLLEWVQGEKDDVVYHASSPINTGHTDLWREKKTLSMERQSPPQVTLNNPLALISRSLGPSLILILDTQGIPGNCIDTFYSCVMRRHVLQATQGGPTLYLPCDERMCRPC